MTPLPDASRASLAGHEPCCIAETPTTFFCTMKKAFFVALFASTTGFALAQPYNNWVSSDGQVVRSGFNQCWRNASWTPETAHPDCDGALRSVPAAPAPAAAASSPSPAPAASAAPTKVTFAAEAFFDFDRAALKAEGKSQLDGLVEKLTSLNWSSMGVVGHTDSVGSASYNQGLSLRRAESVKNYLVTKGLPAALIQASGQGESQPVADNSTAAGRAKNRRVEIEVVGTAK